MKQTLVDVRLALANRISQLRCIERIVLSEEFGLIYSASSDDKQSLVVSMIEKADKKSIQSWMKSQIINQADFEDLPLKDLRLLGHQLGVQNYSQLPKHLLVIEIRARTNARVIVSNRVPSQTNEGINAKGRGSGITL